MAKAVKKVKSSTAPKTPKSEEPAFDPVQHAIVPKHEKLGAKEAAALLEEYHTTVNNLPRILITDPAIRGLAVKVGDIIKITRNSYTAGEIAFYRGVVDE